MPRNTKKVRKIISTFAQMTGNMIKIHLATLVAVFTTTVAAAQDVSFHIAKYKGDKACATSFTFDDGLEEHLSIVAPELEKRGWRGTFWVCGAKVSGEKKTDDAYLSWDEIRQLSESGHEVSNHGWNHKKLSKLSRERIIEEVQMNDSAIFVHTGRRPDTFCYPYNSKNETVLEITEKGRVGTRTKQFALGQAVDHEKTVRRIDDAVRKGDWAVWMTHGITKGYDSFKEPERFIRFLDYVKSIEDKVWVATFHEVAAYQKERESVMIGVTQKGRKYVVTPSLELDACLFDQNLTLVIEGMERAPKVRQDGHRLAVYNMEAGKYLVDFNPFGGEIIVK